MTPDDFDVKWAQRTRFAEVAEVLGVDTNMIMAMTVIPHTRGRVLVLFTYPQEVTRIYKCTLRRDSQGVLHKYGPPEEVPGMYEQLTAEVEERARARFGKPKRDTGSDAPTWDELPAGPDNPEKPLPQRDNDA
jgi:hypothetical protein